MIELEVEGNVVITTEDHPFWNDTDKQWQRSDALNRGDVVLSADGRRLSVGGLRPDTEHTGSTYNLTVAGIHTYYVLAGDTPVLVHNTCGNGLDDVLATPHGQQRLVERGFDNVDIALTRGSATAYEQLDGAVAHVAQVGENSYNIIVVGEGGIVTAMKGLPLREVNNLARNYGWTGYP